MKEWISRRQRGTRCRWRPDASTPGRGEVVRAGEVSDPPRGLPVLYSIDDTAETGRWSRSVTAGTCTVELTERSFFNLLTARELGPKFGPRSVPYALGGKQDMNTEHRVRSRSLWGTDARPGPAGTAPRSLLPAALALGLALSARAQNPPLPPPAQAASALQQAVQQNPGLADMIRQRIAQSGMTPEQIRARLQASGYPPTLLDAYLGAQTPGQPSPVPGAQEIAAIQSLGVPTLATAGEILPVDTGLVRATAAGKSGVFGVDVFQRTTTQFLPLLAGPVPADYKLGPGDQLVLILTGDVELAYTLQVTREGFILIPQVGQLFVSNVTLDQLRDLLYTRLGRVYSGVRRSPAATTRFDISVANVRANQAYVVGEVAQPGAYQISSLGTVLTALYAAGGVTERAKLRGVEVRRFGKVVATFDLYDYLLRGDAKHDVRLETGDVVFVPVHGPRAEITGAVRRPATHALEGGGSLAGLSEDAGGFRPDAQLKRLSVFRLLSAAERGPGAPPRAVIDVALSAFPSPKSRDRGSVAPGDPPVPVSMPQMALQDGDSVVVDELQPLSGQYYVSIVGVVNKPGVYPWRDGMTLDRKSTRLNSSHITISYAVFCLKKKKK